LSVGFLIRSLLLLPGLLVVSHNCLRPLKDLILAHRHCQLEQQLPIDRLDVVEGHPVGTDHPSQHVVNALHTLLLLQFSEELLQIVLVAGFHKTLCSSD
jgi:hypothetical protein